MWVNPYNIKFGVGNIFKFYCCPLYAGNPQTSTFANSEDQDEMQHHHQSGTSLFVKVKKDLQINNTIFVENYNLTPLDMYNGHPTFIVPNQKD